MSFIHIPGQVLAKRIRPGGYVKTGRSIFESLTGVAGNFRGSPRPWLSAAGFHSLHARSAM